MEDLDGIDSIRLAPMHQKDLHTKFDDTMLLKEHIRATTDTFLKYARAGSKLCDAMGALANSFTKFKEFQSDGSFRRISALLVTLQDAFSAHYASIRDTIVQPLLDFIATDIKQVESCSRKAAQCYHQHTVVLDQFVQPNTAKKKSHDSMDLIGKVQKSYWDAVRSDFEFQRSLELVDAKRLTEIAVRVPLFANSQFVTFLNTASIPYYQAQDAFVSAKDSFLALSSALQDSRTIEQRFTTTTTNIQTSLEGYFRIYTRRFTMAFPGTPAMELEGLLWKQGSGLTKSWQLRYFVVARHCIYYHHGASDSDSPQGKLNLLCTSVKVLSTPGCFSVISPTKIYTLRAVTDYERDEWVAVIQNNIAHLLENGGDAPTSEHSSDQVVPQSLPCNAVCADCGAPAPTWTALNWGVCVCIHCCATHRMMGVNISKPRSLTLDRLPDAALRILEVVGNERANAVLEEAVGDAKIGDGATGKERDEFIRRKYMARDFVKVESINLIEAVRAGDYVAVFRAICQRALEVEQGYTSLHCAASLGDPVMALLLAYNAPGEVPLDRGWSPLSYAAFYGHKGVAKALISAGCVSNDPQQSHPYDIAVSKKDEEMALLCLPFWHGTASPVGTFIPPVPLASLTSEKDKS
jgi:hypothetical protein